jgi:YHS domain-containing protein
MKKIATAFLLGFLASALAGEVKPYPLQTCIVSDEPLDASRHPISINYQGQEVQVCCRECKRDFQNDPQKFLKKIPAAE